MEFNSVFLFFFHHLKLGFLERFTQSKKLTWREKFLTKYFAKKTLSAQNVKS